MPGDVPDSKDEIRAALARARLHPLKRFGQHFLADAAVLDRIVAESGAGPSSVVLEVGPGLGGLTARLLAAGAAVVAVEIDHGLARELRSTLVSPDFILLEQDVMAKKGRLADEVGAALLACAERRGTRGFEVVANLPYGISSSFLLALASRPGPPLRATVMLQTEVADALAAKPSTEEYSALSVSCQVSFAVTKAFKVGRHAFFPQPDVDSTVVTLFPRSGADVPERFGDFVQKLFQGRRKALSTTLKPWLPREVGASRDWLAKAGVDPGTRVEALPPAGILDLYRRVQEAGGGGRVDVGDIVRGVIGDLQDDIERVRTATDIVTVVSRYVQLKRAGRNLKACCPFHDEKTPSFNVSPEKQFFKCFGCGAGGSVFDFVMRVERQTFVEALRGLAKEAGIELTPQKGVAQPRQARDDVARVLDWAARGFAANLAHQEGEACRRYVEQRGISPKEAGRFGLGYSRPGWRSLLDEAQRQKIGTDLLLAAGLVLKNQQGNVYDAFRNRLMFPIRNSQGSVIAFGARSLDGSEPKYLNSPESEVFRKRQTVYGLESLGALKQGEPVLIMEGYTDVIMATQWGVRGAVATLGTSLTPEQVRLIRRYADRAILVYDGDKAGSEASVRAIPLLLGGGLDLRVVLLPGGEDPCDFFLRRKDEGVGDLLVHARELADFMIEKGVAKFDLGTIDGKRRAADFFAEILAAIEDPVVRATTVARAAAAANVPAPTLSDLVAAVRSRPARRTAPTAPAASAPDAARQARRSPPARKSAIKDIMDVCLNRPALIEPAHVERLPELLVEEGEGARELLGRVLRRACGAAEASAVEILSVVEDDAFRRFLGSLIREVEDLKDLRPQLEGAFRYLENDLLDREKDTLADTVKLTGSDDALRLLYENRRLRAEEMRRQAKAPAEEGA